MKTNNIFKFIIIGLTIIFLFYLVIHNLTLKKEINLNQESKSYFIYRLSLLDREKEIQRKIIGTKIILDGIITNGDSSAKILMFLFNELASKKSLFDALRFYQYMLQRKKINSKVRLIVIIPTKSKAYIKSLSIQFAKKTEFYPDTSLNLFRKIGLSDNDNGIFLLTKSFRCIYCYLIEIDNPLRDVQESKIIVSYIGFNSLR